ncbi:hypothetical protein DUNSADRAFT_8114 [Dunaliella salina]|uniref:Encoded protein n=1 Tax=Dunaliella salina TaxID=3046 RepID=A0ABQ7GK18_DUNSA|nr:hypothetical protein DUNSADRAFT_8114 [Dunaliella salina]|eukprot:KAF5834965.1 hypothetical protein DUNSADRAFT_8114 [Dunaliella salina]
MLTDTCAGIAYKLLVSGGQANYSRQGNWPKLRTHITGHPWLSYHTFLLPLRLEPPFLGGEGGIEKEAPVPYDVLVSLLAGRATSFPSMCEHHHAHGNAYSEPFFPFHWCVEQHYTHGNTTLYVLSVLHRLHSCKNRIRIQPSAPNESHAPWHLVPMLLR